VQCNTRRKYQAEQASGRKRAKSGRSEAPRRYLNALRRDCRDDEIQNKQMVGYAGFAG
jgi:hypothetical protein